MPNEASQKAAKSGGPVKKLTPEEQREADYQSACSAASWGKWTVFYQDRAEFYRNAQQQFLALGDYKDSTERAAWCAAQAEEAETVGCDQALQEAMSKAKSAVTANDYYMAARALERITDRPEAQAEAERCLTIYEQSCRRQRVKRLIVSAAICILAVFGIGLVQTGAAQYGLATFCLQQDRYADALKWYLEAREFGDSEERIAECRYLRGVEFQEQGKYLQAYDKFRLISGYEDADDRLLDCVRGMLADLSPGDTITFGKLNVDEKAKWVVLENDGTSVTMLGCFGLEHSYHNASGAVTWKDCELRNWLNTEFIAETFHRNERSLLLYADLDNASSSVYETDGGDDTSDRVYLLSEAEAEKFSSILFDKDENGKTLDPYKAEKLGWRLRTPGAAGDGTAFVNTSSKINRYGFESTSKQLMVRPVIQVSIVE
ncbi:MAG: DUF6273 domain-containing protein [Candidatus Onthomonas sp.]